MRPWHTLQATASVVGLLLGLAFGSSGCDGGTADELRTAAGATGGTGGNGAHGATGGTGGSGAHGATGGTGGSGAHGGSGANGGDGAGGAPPTTNLDIAAYHQQPLSSNDGGPFYGSSGYEGWCNTASLYMVLHSFVPDLPSRLQTMYPSWSSWRGGSLPSGDPYFYDSDATYNMQEFLQDEYLGYLVGAGGVGFSGIETMANGVAADLGLQLTYQYVPLAEMRDRLLQGWLGIMNNWEWGGHYLVVVWYEAGANPDDPSQRYYYILDPTNIEAGNSDILSNLDSTRTENWRDLVRSRQECGSVDCERDSLGIYVLNATGVNAIFRGAQSPTGTLAMVHVE